MRKCIKCETEKEDIEFWKNKYKPDGIHNICKKCANDEREKRRDPEKEKIYRRKTYLKHRESRIQRQLKYERNLSIEKKLERDEKRRIAYRNNSDAKRNKRNYQKNIYDPIKLKANKILNEAIRLKQIIRPKTCSICNEITKLDGHHADYSKPLEVIWVCRKCHRTIHKRLKEK
jgi:hypothetical protein